MKKASLKNWKKTTPTKKTEKKPASQPPVPIPERSCIACGKTAEKKSFLRFVSDGQGKVIFDRKGRLPGRGVYICLNEECLKSASKKNLFAKGFKENIDKKEYAQLLAELYTVFENYFFALLKSGRGAGLVVGGSSKCEKLLETSAAQLVLIPDNASEDTVKKVLALAEAKNVKIVVCPDKLTMATELDLPLQASFVVTDAQLAAAVCAALENALDIKRMLNGV